MKRIIGILTLSCLLFSACGKDDIPQEENEKKTEETTPDNEDGDNSDGDEPNPPIQIADETPIIFPVPTRDAVDTINA